MKRHPIQIAAEIAHVFLFSFEQSLRPLFNASVSVKVPWSWVKPPFNEIPFPIVGDESAWKWWYERAWKRLTEQGLAEADNPLDLVKIRLRAFALIWITWDFSAAAERLYYWDYYWDAWLKELEIPFESLAIILTGEEVSLLTGEEVSLSMVAELAKRCSWEETDDNFVRSVIDEKGSLEDLFGDAVPVCRDIVIAKCVELYRQEVLDALEKSFGSLREFCIDLFVVPALENTVESITDEIREECGEILDRLVEERDSTKRAKLSKRLEQLTSDLDPENVQDQAIDQIKSEVAATSIDDSRDECHHGVMWAEDGCPLVLSFYRLHSDE